MDEIISVVLNHFQDVLSQLNTENQKQDTSLGVPPTFLIVEQKEFSTLKSRNIGDTLGCWKVYQTSSEEFNGNLDLLVQEQNGMYYSHGLCDFSIDNNGAKVRIGWQAGPRFGRGYEISIVKRNNTIELVDQKTLWIS